jgi:hypothetical protein
MLLSSWICNVPPISALETEFEDVFCEPEVLVPLLLFLSVVPVVVLEAAPVVPDVIGLEELERSIVVATAVPLPNVVTSVVVVVENELVKVVPGAVVLPVVSTPLDAVVSFNICGPGLVEV